MNFEDRKLFLTLCRFLDPFDRTLIEHINDEVFGKLLANRMGPVGYGVFSREGLLDCIGREYRTVLKTLYDSSVQKNKLFAEQVICADSILKSTDVPYALLKGAILCSGYPAGFRSANDIDILVSF